MLQLATHATLHKVHPRTVAASVVVRQQTRRQCSSQFLALWGRTIARACSLCSVPGNTVAGPHYYAAL